VNENQVKEKEKDNSKKIIIILIIFIVLLLMLLIGIIIGFFLLRDKPAEEVDGLIIDKSAVEWQRDPLVIEEDLNNSDGYYSSSYKVYGYFESTMKAGNKANITMTNAHENECYFQFTLILDETEEVLYESGWVPPGNAVLRQELSRSLDKGVYEVTLKLSAVELEEPHYEMTGTDMKMKLIVN